MIFKLSPTDDYSETFDFVGDCYICIVGEGEVTIERKVGEEFHAVTYENGQHRTYTGEGVLFNDKLTSRKAIKHRFKVSTTSGVQIDLIRGR